MIFFLFVCLFVWVKDLCPSQQFFSHIGTFSWIEPVLSNEDEVSCSRTQYYTTGEIQTQDLAIKSLALYQLSQRCSTNEKMFYNLGARSITTKINEHKQLHREDSDETGLSESMLGTLVILFVLSNSHSIKTTGQLFKASLA